MWSTVTILVIFCLGSSSGEKNVYHFVYTMENDVDIPQDIIHDTNDNTVLIIIGDVPNYPGPESFTPTVNFHDFDSGYVAFKDISKQTCHVSKAPIPFPVPHIYKMGHVAFKDFPRGYIANDTSALNLGEAAQLAGQKIANFCRGYTTYRRILTHYDTTDGDVSLLNHVRRQKEQLSNEQEKTDLEPTSEPNKIKPTPSPENNCTFTNTHFPEKHTRFISLLRYFV